VIRAHSAIKAMRDALAADSLLSQQASSGIYGHRFPAPPQETQWCRVVVRELLGAELDERSGFVLQPLQVSVQATGYDDIDLLLAATHESICRVLTGLMLDTSHGISLLPIERTTRPGAATYDEKTGSYASACLYLVPLTSQ